MTRARPASLPHPVPYQGSKRRLAGRILAGAGDRRVATLYEPFAGSAALTLAAAARGIAARHVLGDSLAPLAAIWQAVLDDPADLADAYAALWDGQAAEGAAAHFARVRDAFNADPDPARLLYLLARCVKNAPRFGPGGFNQAPDHRRSGMHPDRMRGALLGAGALLTGRTTVVADEAERCLAGAGPEDLVYLDPPWQGTTEGADPRYHRGFPRARLEVLLADLEDRGVPWLLSYDGRSGGRTYGDPLPGALWGAHLELPAGRSAQATLAGRSEHTVESLYVGRALAAVSPRR